MAIQFIRGDRLDLSCHRDKFRVRFVKKIVLQSTPKAALASPRSFDSPKRIIITREKWKRSERRREKLRRLRDECEQTVTFSGAKSGIGGVISESRYRTEDDVSIRDYISTAYPRHFRIYRFCGAVGGPN